ncbi:hypothetical protein ES288_A10G052200v1 [Gossypium darwinii]|uniref:UspA domain-containing protein n=2 Tax=Gossypium TaxID=3633 RepID=A0A5D2J8L9_GOSTO|nr:hypothetical protein ES288_A10G052200v1 [Gossypium darwinii]TYH51271.1 hypothetical protein ES332_D10G261400v1 [Gossypium tomentosum]
MAGNLGCVVVSVDGNEGSMDALRWALDNDLEVPAFTAAIEAHQKRITDAILNHALQICAEKKANVKTQVVIGDPKEKICEVIENVHADLLVMGSRAFGPIKRYFPHCNFSISHCC